MASTSKFPSQLKPSACSEAAITLTLVAAASHFLVMGSCCSEGFCDTVLIHYPRVSPSLQRHTIRLCGTVSLQSAVTGWQVPVSGMHAQVVCHPG